MSLHALSDNIMCNFIFLFFDINNLANFLQEINKTSEVYTKNSHLSKKFPFFFPIMTKCDENFTNFVAFNNIY